MFKKGISTVLIITISIGLFAQSQVRITLKDGDVISGTTSLSKVSLSTNYGKLDIPAKNVSGLQFGVKPDNDENEKAVDVIEFDNNYSMAGQTNIKSLDVKTSYGNLSIPADKIEHMEMYVLIEGQSTYRLMASKHISSNTTGGWLNTGIMLKKGDNFTITANGQVVFASLSGSQYTPDGKLVGGAGNSGYDYGTEGGYDNSYPTYGNVVYKIGEQGTMKKAGDKYSGTADDLGMLFISIYEAVYNPSNTGSYVVKIEKK